MANCDFCGFSAKRRTKLVFTDGKKEMVCKDCFRELFKEV